MRIPSSSSFVLAAALVASSSTPSLAAPAPASSEGGMTTFSGNQLIASQSGTIIHRAEERDNLLDNGTSKDGEMPVECKPGDHPDPAQHNSTSQKDKSAANSAPLSTQAQHSTDKSISNPAYEDNFPDAELKVKLSSMPSSPSPKFPVQLLAAEAPFPTAPAVPAPSASPLPPAFPAPPVCPAHPGSPATPVSPAPRAIPPAP